MFGVPERIRQMIAFFTFVAAVCLVLSLLAHGSTFVGVNPIQQMPGFWLLPLVIMMVFFAALAVGQKQINKTSKHESRDFVWRYSPSWLQKVVYIFCLYAGFNFFFTHFSLLEGGLPKRINGERVLASHGKVVRKLTREEYERAEAHVARAVSGHLMPFSSSSLMILIASRRCRRATRAGRPGTEISEARNRAGGALLPREATDKPSAVNEAAVAEYPMIRAEFIERNKASKAGDKWLGSIFLIVLVLACVLWPRLTDQVNQWGIPWLTELFNRPWAVFLLFVLLFGLLTSWIKKWKGLAARMVCANCGAVLTNYLAAIAIATGNRGQCGKKAFDDGTV